MEGAMTLKLTIIVGMTLLFISGCATQGVNSYNYSPPVSLQIKNEGIIQKPYSQVWDTLVKKISKSFYVINNIDKESSSINVLFNTNTPVNFVDCGKTHRKYTLGNKVEVFDYDVAAASQFKVAGKERPRPSWASYAIIRREPSLEGSANISIAPDDKDKNKTVVTVAARYIWTISVRGETYIEDIRGHALFTGRLPEETEVVSFNTNTNGEFNSGNASCISKGKLEAEILGLID
jgi:hypothetical protein